MSPGGTDTMQISNGKRITRIHHCTAAHAVATTAGEDGGGVGPSAMWVNDCPVTVGNVTYQNRDTGHYL